MEKTGGSRLLQMQARFQQKQMQEKELKIASLYEAQQARALDRVRHSPGSVTSSPTPAPPPLTQPGKVRQMFEERRTKAGIDKSYPLKPIQNTERPAVRKQLPNGYSKVSSTTSMTSNTSSRVSEKKSTVKTKTTSSLQNIKRHTQSIHKVEKITNGNGDVNHNHVQSLNSSNHDLAIEEPKLSTDELDKDNNYLIENETFPEALAPEPTPRSAERRPEKLDKPERPPRKSPAVTSSPVRTKSQPAPAAPPRRSTPTAPSTQSPVPDIKKAQGGAMQRKTARSTTAAASGGAESKARLSSAGGAGAPCAVCGRRFAQDRLPTHEAICRKHATKKRKPFDALKHRLAGTEAEPFIGKLRKSTGSTNKTNKPLNSTWRKKHEEFIASIRAAKQVQAHLNAGGKLSDLPPPPPSENADYVSCPHCGRRFNQAAAERHIPKCANFQFNKPKPSKKR